MTKHSPNHFTDEKLAAMAKAGNTRSISELVVRFTPVVTLYAKRYANIGPELEDLMQEGMIALLGAIRSYREDGGAQFSTYASRCIANKILSAITAYYRGKNSPLNFYASLDEAEQCSAPSHSDPQEMFIHKEEEQRRREQMNSLLSVFEMEALRLYLSGYRYEEIAQCLGCTTKSVDNALQRVRRKLQAADRP